MDDAMTFKRSNEMKYDMSREDTIKVSSWLYDEVAGEVMHDIKLDMVISKDTFNILTIETTIDTPKYLNCQEAIQGLQRLVGLNLARGFNKQVLAINGGVRGCFHLNNMIMQIGSTSLLSNIFKTEEGIMKWKKWVARCKKDPDNVKENVKIRSNQVPEIKNSCYVFQDKGCIDTS